VTSAQKTGRACPADAVLRIKRGLYLGFGWASSATKVIEPGAGKLIDSKNGRLITVDDHAVGAIGVGSGTGEQDLEVVKAALAVFTAA
jgi:uncharacterized protein GlcG (DUF336 family)